MDITINKAHISFKENVDKLFEGIRVLFNHEYKNKMKELDDREDVVKEKEVTIKKFRRQSLLASMDKQVFEKNKEIKFLKDQLAKSKKKLSNKKSKKIDISEEIKKLENLVESKDDKIEQLLDKIEQKDNQIKELLDDSDNLIDEEDESSDDKTWIEIKIKNKECLLNNKSKKVYEVANDGKHGNWIGKLTEKGTFKRRKKTSTKL